MARTQAGCGPKQWKIDGEEKHFDMINDRGNSHMDLNRSKLLCCEEEPHLEEVLIYHLNSS